MHQHPEHIIDRSTIDLLTLPYPFSQVPLMTEADFCRAAVQRGITLSGRHDLDRSALEELHRHQIIVPFYCVTIAGPPVAPKIDASASLTANHVLSTITTELYRAAAEGRVGDPSAMPFRSWPTKRKRTTWPGVERGYLYSQHQLLGLRAARGYVAELRQRKIRDRQYRWILPPSIATACQGRSNLHPFAPIENAPPLAQRFKTNPPVLRRHLAQRAVRRVRARCRRHEDRAGVAQAAGAL
jgi:hypothetical protein